jgi:hypothetical protein
MLRLKLSCPYCGHCQVRLDVGASGVAVRPNPPPHGRCAHLVYLEGQYAPWQGARGEHPHLPRAHSFDWYHPAFTVADPGGELRDGILTGMVNLYPSRDVFRTAEPFEVAVASTGRSGGEPADHDLYACALFAPEALACVQGVLAVDPRHRRG